MKKFPNASKSDLMLAIKIYEAKNESFTAGDLEERLGVKRSKIYKAMSVLNHLGLIIKQRKGRRVTYKISKNTSN